MPRNAEFGEVYALPPAVLHSAGVSITKPCPLQAFWPLQELFAVLHSLMPLQELPPSQWTLALLPLEEPPVAAQPVINKAAAVAAIARPASLLLPSTICFSLVICRIARLQDPAIVSWPRLGNADRRRRAYRVDSYVAPRRMDAGVRVPGRATACGTGRCVFKWWIVPAE